MRISGEHTFAAPRDAVWAALLDPEVLARTLPGCEDLKQCGEHEFEGQLLMRVGPVQGIFQGRVTLSDLDPPRGYRLTLAGKGAPGFVNGSGQLTLEESGDSTVLRYDVDAQVGGRIAGVGQRLLDSSAKVITRQALEGLDAQIRARSASDGAPSAVAPTPSSGRFAAALLGGLLGELVPRERRTLVIVSLLGLVLVAVAVLLRGCG